MKRTKQEAAIDKRNHLKQMENSGVVADSLDYRKALMEKVSTGEITLEQAQSELAKTKKTAKRNGLKTRAQVYREG